MDSKHIMLLLVKFKIDFIGENMGSANTTLKSWANNK